MPFGSFPLPDRIERCCMKKNSSKNINVEWEMKETGNWNFRDTSIPSLCTKPITVVKLDGDEFVFCHHDIMELIKAYHTADKKSIQMIKEGKAGSVTNFETPLLDKLQKFIRELKNEDAGVCDNGYNRNDP
jgi:hypothetical protein